MCQSRLREHGEAKQSFERVLRLWPHFLPARSNLGNQLYALGKPEAAKKQYRLALAQDPAFHHSNLALVTVLRREGAREAVLEQSRSWARHAAGDPRAWQALAQALLDLDSADEAELQECAAAIDRAEKLLEGKGKSSPVRLSALAQLRDQLSRRQGGGKDE